jgi:hypothetical protein
VAERREVSNKQVSQREREYEVEVKLRNRKRPRSRSWSRSPWRAITRSCARAFRRTRKDANTLQFSVPVPAGKEVVLTYAIRVRY